VIHVVDLATGGDAALEQNGLLFRHPVISPGGERVVVEGYPLIIVADPVTETADTTVSRRSDLYLFSAQ
jgi:sensor domain CHASE-containing protein